MCLVMRKQCLLGSNRVMTHLLEILFVVKNKFVDTTELCFVTSHPHPTSDVNFATSFVMDSFLM